MGNKIIAKVSVLYTESIIAVINSDFAHKTVEQTSDIRDSVFSLRLCVFFNFCPFLAPIPMTSQTLSRTHVLKATRPSSLSLRIFYIYCKHGFRDICKIKLKNTVNYSSGCKRFSLLEHHCVTHPSADRTKDIL